MPPFVPSFGPGDGLAGALQHQNVLNKRDFGDSCIDDGLGGDGLATTATFVGGDDDAAAAIEHSVAERLGAEAGKDDRVYGANTGACEEGGGGLPGHGEVNGDGVTLLDAE